MANFLTTIRLVCGLLLPCFPSFSRGFYVCYLLAGFTDTLDGPIARTWNEVSEFGAKFDTVADTVFVLSVLYKVLSAVHVPLWMGAWIGVIALIKAGNVLMGFVLYRKYVAVHSAANRVCGVLVFATPLYIGCAAWELSVWMIGFTCAAAILAAVWEGYCVHTGKW